MLAFAARTIFVKEASDNTSAWLAFIGAILVALIAASTAQWRLRAQLGHDRRLADLADLRASVGRLLFVLDSSADTLDDTWKLRGSEDTEAIAALHETLAELLVRVNEATNETRIRVSTSDPLIAAVAETNEPRRACIAAIGAGDEEAFKASRRELSTAVDGAYSVAQRLVGSKVN